VSTSSFIALVVDGRRSTAASAADDVVAVVTADNVIVPSLSTSGRQ